MKYKFPLKFFVSSSFLIAALLVSSSSSAVVFLSDPAGPSDPTVGNWDPSTKTLTLTRDVNDGFQIASSDITLDGKDPVTGVKHKIELLRSPTFADRGVFIIPGLTNVTVKNCDISQFFFGALVVGGVDHQLISNEFHENGLAGILITGSSNNSRVSNNKIENERVGALIIGGTGHEVIDNEFLNSQNNGLNLSNATFSKVMNNTAVGNNIAINNGSDNELIGNQASDSPNGISLNWTTRCYVRNNTMENNSQTNFKIDGPVGGGRDAVDNVFNHDIDLSNTANGKVIYYFKGETGLNVNPSTHPNAAAFYFYECSGITVEDYVFDNVMDSAVQLMNTHDSTIRNIDSINNKFGINLFSSDRNTIEMNAVRMREDHPFDNLLRGIEIKESSGNMVRNNLVYGDGWRGIAIGFGGSSNLIQDNFVFGADQSIVCGSELNIVEGNVAVDGGGISVGVPGCIIRNNVVANGTEVLFFGRRDVPFERGIWVQETSDVQVYNNLIYNMLDNGVHLEGAPSTLFYNNDVIDNALPGTNPDGNPIYQAFSDTKPFEFSIAGTGNYWGRDTAPHFVPEVDSNAFDVVDSHATGTPHVLIPIDIKPGEGENSINLNSKGVIAVAVLSTGYFDARSLDPNTALFHGLLVKSNNNGTLLVHEEDVNGDGLTDIVCQFDNDGSLMLDDSSTYAFFVAKTFDGQMKYGQDSVKILP